MQQMSQVNPMLFQQQMIYNMQYRQPNYQHFNNNNNQQRNNQTGKNNKQTKNKESSDQSDTKASESSQNQFDEDTIQQKLQYILQMSQDQVGVQSDNPEVRKQEMHVKLSSLVNGLVNKI
jgi:hypothetical protein